jgi:hypothetical protein
MRCSFVSLEVKIRPRSRSREGRRQFLVTRVLRGATAGHGHARCVVDLSTRSPAGGNAPHARSAIEGSPAASCGRHLARWVQWFGPVRQDRLRLREHWNEGDLSKVARWSMMRAAEQHQRRPDSVLPRKTVSVVHASRIVRNPVTPHGRTTQSMVRRPARRLLLF